MAEPQSPASGPEAKTEYGRWISQFDTLTAQHRSTIADAIGKLANPPMVSVIMTGNGSNLGPAKERNRTLASLRAQLYPHWEALIAIGTDQPNADLDQVRILEQRLSTAH